MRVAIRHDAVADTVAKLALTVKTFEHELEMLDEAKPRISAQVSREGRRGEALGTLLPFELCCQDL